MNLATIETTPEEAKSKLDEYRIALQHEHTAEDEALAQAYRAVARGLTVIRLSEVVAAGGSFPNGLPRIAVVRADAQECFVDVDRWRHAGEATFTFGSERRARNRGALVNAKTVRVSVPTPAVEGREAWAGRTTVPLIPPRHRPKRPRLSRCHLLWEVEAWDPTPPVDPALVRHLRGDLWAVLAVWDLTELERAVLSGRAR
jgi:hypothetical protein